MGTTLTGTTPQDTYDSLIKVTDNGPLSGTAKYLSDGLGNDSALALSTTGVGIGTSSPLAKLDVRGTTYLTSTGTDGTLGDAIIFGNSAFPNTQSNRIRTTTSASASSNGIALEAGNGTTGSYVNNQLVLRGDGNVGIGTSSPAFKLDVNGVARTRTGTDGIDVGNPSGNSYRANLLLRGTTAVGANSVSYIGVNVFNTAGSLDVTSDADIIIRNGATERARFLAGGGLTFNGDTAAANALDDYEEGTFTATLTPTTSGTIGGNPTFTTWTYTKIGRKVTINGVFVVNAVSSPVGTEVSLNLPFTVLNSNGAYGAASVSYFDQSASTWSARPNKHSISTLFLDIIIDASTIQVNDEIYVTATYFV